MTGAADQAYFESAELPKEGPSASATASDCPGGGCASRASAGPLSSILEDLNEKLFSPANAPGGMFGLDKELEELSKKPDAKEEAKKKEEEKKAKEEEEAKTKEKKEKNGENKTEDKTDGKKDGRDNSTLIIPALHSNEKTDTTAQQEKTETKDSKNDQLSSNKDEKAQPYDNGKLDFSNRIDETSRRPINPIIASDEVTFRIISGLRNSDSVTPSPISKDAGAQNTNIAPEIKTTYANLLSQAIPTEDTKDPHSPLVQLKTWLTANANDASTITRDIATDSSTSSRSLIQALASSIVDKDGKINQPQVAQIIESLKDAQIFLALSQRLMESQKSSSSNDESTKTINTNNPTVAQNISTVSDKSVQAVKENTVIASTSQSDASSATKIVTPVDNLIINKPTAKFEDSKVSSPGLLISILPGMEISQPKHSSSNAPVLSGVEIRATAQQLLVNNIAQALTELSTIQSTPFANWNIVLGDKAPTPVSNISQETKPVTIVSTDQAAVKGAESVPQTKSIAANLVTEKVQPIISSTINSSHPSEAVARNSVVDKGYGQEQTSHLKSLIENGYIQLTNALANKLPAETILAAVIEAAEKQLGRSMNSDEKILVEKLVNTDKVHRTTDVHSNTPWSGSLPTTIKSGGATNITHSTGSQTDVDVSALPNPNLIAANAVAPPAQGPLSAQSSTGTLLSRTNSGANLNQSAQKTKRDPKGPVLFTVSINSAFQSGIAI